MAASIPLSLIFRTAGPDPIVVDHEPWAGERASGVFVAVGGTAAGARPRSGQIEPRSLSDRDRLRGAVRHLLARDAERTLAGLRSFAVIRPEEHSARIGVVLRRVVGTPKPRLEPVAGAADVVRRRQGEVAGTELAKFIENGRVVRGTAVRRDRRLQQGPVRHRGGRLVNGAQLPTFNPKLVIQRLLLHVRQNKRGPSPARLPGGGKERVAGRERLACRLETDHGQSGLLEIARAGQAASRFPRRLHGRKQQRNQHGDNGDHDQQLHQREGRLPR